jgi:Molybdopterin-binding domain of aldehyde dehydrogenase
MNRVEALEKSPAGPSTPLSIALRSMGTASWGSAMVKACQDLLKNEGDLGRADTAEDVKADSRFARHAFGAQFAEVHVDAGTGEVRVPRLLGVFAAGRIIDPTLARSQFIGGMTMGLGMALMEQTVVDAAQGGFVRRDLAQYHIATCRPCCSASGTSSPGTVPRSSAGRIASGTATCTAAKTAKRRSAGGWTSAGAADSVALSTSTHAA